MSEEENTTPIVEEEAPAEVVEETPEVEEVAAEAEESPAEEESPEESEEAPEAEEEAPEEEEVKKKLKRTRSVKKDSVVEEIPKEIPKTHKQKMLESVMLKIFERQRVLKEERLSETEMQITTIIGSRHSVSIEDYERLVENQND